MALNMTPLPHQEEAVKKLDKSPGGIAFHGLGSGKTFTAILAGQKHGKTLVVPPAALVENFKKEVRKSGANKANYSVVSLETFRKNPDAIIDKEKPSLVVGDEIHRIRNFGVGQDAFASTRKRYPKFLGLTGSPISNHPSEIVPLVNLAAGANVFKDQESFTHDFVDTRVVKPGLFGRLLGVKPGKIEVAKNIDIFKKRVSPYVHSFSGDARYLENLPKVERKVERVKMTEEQQKLYDHVFGQLSFADRYRLRHNIPMKSPERLNAFFSAARRVSNTPAALGGTGHSPKVKAIMHDIEKGKAGDPRFKSVTFSNFLEGGLHDVATELRKKNIEYGMFTGEQDDYTRQKTIKAFNSDRIKHLLVSPAGVEGLDLKGVRLAQLMDPNWNPEKTKQAIGRAARYKSHESLPIKDRSVAVREYLAVPRAGLVAKVKRFFGGGREAHELGVDEYMYNRAAEKDQLNSKFLDALREIK